MLSGRESKVWT